MHVGTSGLLVAGREGNLPIIKGERERREILRSLKGRERVHPRPPSCTAGSVRASFATMRLHPPECTCMPHMTPARRITVHVHARLTHTYHLQPAWQRVALTCMDMALTCMDIHGQA